MLLDKALQMFLNPIHISSLEYDQCVGEGLGNNLQRVHFLHCIFDHKEGDHYMQKLLGFNTPFQVCQLGSKLRLDQ